MFINIMFNNGNEYGYECINVHISPTLDEYSYIHFYGRRYSYENYQDYLFPLKKISHIDII